MRVRSSCFSTTFWISLQDLGRAAGLHGAGLERLAPVRARSPSSASSLKCERGTERRTLASDAMSRVTFGPGHLDAEELDVAAAAQLELDHELELLERRHLLLEVARRPPRSGPWSRRSTSMRDPIRSAAVLLKGHRAARRPPGPRSSRRRSRPRPPSRALSARAEGRRRRSRPRPCIRSRRWSRVPGRPRRR